MQTQWVAHMGKEEVVMMIAHPMFALKMVSISKHIKHQVQHPQNQGGIVCVSLNRSDGCIVRWIVQTSLSPNRHHGGMW
jgi:hypothetical protein